MSEFNRRRHKGAAWHQSPRSQEKNAVCDKKLFLMQRSMFACQVDFGKEGKFQGKILFNRYITTGGKRDAMS
jgi:hypothetical protein